MKRILKIIPPFIAEVKLGWAIREVLQKGYNNRQFASDLQAGLIVGVVALPLAMALAIASGAPPQNGLYTVVIAGTLVAVLGGSRFQVTGPTAAFVALLLPVVERFGLAGLLTAGFLAGIMCLLYGVLRLGDIIQYVPHPVTTGFTTGTAIIIASLQFKDFFGLDLSSNSSDFLHRMWAVGESIHTFKIPELAFGTLSLGILFLGQKLTKKVPTPIVALVLTTLVAAAIEKTFPEFSIFTIADRFSFLKDGIRIPGVPTGWPPLEWPWNYQSQKDDLLTLNWLRIKEILPSAFAISLLGSIETLLSATVADGMSRTKHNPNSELIALGIGNIVAPFFGGIPASGAVSRTTANVRFGAVSPLSAVFHSLFVGLILILMAPLIGYIPMATLAGILLFVAWNMSERFHFFNIIKNGSWDDRLVLLTCFTLTVLFDMTVGVGVGVILSSTLFIRRMALVTQADVVERELYLDDEHSLTFGPHVFYYQIRGTLFFGAAQRAMERLSNLSPNFTHAIIDLDEVSFIDMTGKVALASAVQHLRSVHIRIALLSSHEDLQHELESLVAGYHESEVKIIRSRHAAVYWAHPDLISSKEV